MFFSVYYLIYAILSFIRIIFPGFLYSDISLAYMYFRYDLIFYLISFNIWKKSDDRKLIERGEDKKKKNNKIERFLVRDIVFSICSLLRK